MPRIAANEADLYYEVRGTGPAVPDLRNRLRITPVNWHFRNRLVPKSDEVRSGPTPYRRAGRIHHQVHHRRD
jgi:hypothetical protein